MKTSEPPKAATWLLQHLAPGPMNDSLAGDLLEEFNLGRSAAWYWRQVLLAILVGVRGGWLGCGLAVLWGAETYELPWRLEDWLSHWKHIAIFVRLPWPWSMACDRALDLLSYTSWVIAGLTICLFLARRLSRRGVAAGIRVVIPAFVIREIWTTFASSGGTLADVLLSGVVLVLAVLAAHAPKPIPGPVDFRQVRA
jgi:hypothetical protein